MWLLQNLAIINFTYNELHSKRTSLITNFIFNKLADLSDLLNELRYLHSTRRP